VIVLPILHPENKKQKFLMIWELSYFAFIKKERRGVKSWHLGQIKNASLKNAFIKTLVAMTQMGITQLKKQQTGLRTFWSR